MTRVLIVDDDPVQLRLTAEVARRAEFMPVIASGGLEALAKLRADPGIAAVVLDLVMPDLDGMAVMEQMAREGMTIPVIVQTAHSSLEIVVTAMRQGAADFFVKPVAPERLIVSLRNALKLDQLEALVRTERHRRVGTLELADIVTRSPAMQRVLTLAQKAARSPIPVLIEGEAGTGRELVARVIHGIGDRSGKPFIALDCSTIPLNQIDAALFGQSKGASGPDQAGKFVEAQGGTLFLDEVGELSPETQARLLRAIEHGVIEPVGGSRLERINVRVISATSRRLLNLARTGEFREDLYYRLNVFPVYLPPLRERPEDFELLAGHFIAHFAAEAQKRVLGISATALALLQSYNWPGNIRQFENAIYRAIVLSEGGSLEIADFPQIVSHTAGRDTTSRLTETIAAPSAPVHIDALRPLRRDTETREAIRDRFLDERGEVAPLPDLERDLIAFALKHYGGRMSQVARALRIGRSTLYRKLRDYGLDEGVQSNAA